MGLHVAPRFGKAAALVGLASLLSACDIVQGFKNAGDALFPPVKTYLDAPGYRLLEGSYKDLILLTSSELYVLARGTKQGDDSLYSIRYAVPTPCTIPVVGHYWAGGNIDLGVATIAYFHDGASFGLLSFADTRCNVSPLTLPDAELPVDTYVTPPDANGESRMKLVLRSEGRLLMVDPGLGTYDVITETAEWVMVGAGKGGVTFVYAAGSVQAFDRDWKYIDSFGEGMRSLTPTDGSAFFEDVNGIQRATPVSHDGELTIEVKELSPDGCKLGFPAGQQHWVAFYEPCDEGTLAILDLDTDSTTYPEFTVDDPRELVMTVRAGTIDPPTPGAGVWAFILRGIDYNTSLGTVVARTPEGKELVLGERGVLRHTRLDPKEDYGFALLDMSGDKGRYVRWDFDGTLTELARDVLRESPGANFADLTIDYDGTAGTLAQLVHGELVPILARVPPRRFAYTDVEKRQALFSDFDGKNGTLSIGRSVCTPGSNCERQYFEPVPIARKVRHNTHAFLDETEEFLPGIGFLDQYDEERQTGRFQYSNLELGFTSIVSEGVSDFTYAGNGILYSVPYGEGAGIWLARAK